MTETKAKQHCFYQALTNYAPIVMAGQYLRFIDGEPIHLGDIVAAAGLEDARHKVSHLKRVIEQDGELMLEPLIPWVGMPLTPVSAAKHVYRFDIVYGEPHGPF
jgi:hypothetical protein